MSHLRDIEKDEKEITNNLDKKNNFQVRKRFI